jgi:hypothetical protein
MAILLMMHQSQSSTNIPMASSSNRQYELLGKSKDKKSSCEKGDYRKRTLQLAYEIPMVALFRDMKGQRKHEASDVITVSASQLVRFVASNTPSYTHTIMPKQHCLTIFSF